jgi:uncharacterized protein with gpF-like domain
VEEDLLECGYIKHQFKIKKSNTNTKFAKRMSHEDLKEMLMEYSTLEVNIKWIEELQIQDLNSLIGIENDELQWGLLMERLVDADLKYILQRWRNDRKCLDQLLKSTIPRKIKYANKKPKTTTSRFCERQPSCLKLSLIVFIYP